MYVITSNILLWCIEQTDIIIYEGTKCIHWDNIHYM